MRLEIRAQFRLLRRRNRVLEQELHLLPQSATDDAVVFIEPELDRRAIEHFLADVVLDLRLQLGRIGWAMPGPRKRCGKAVDVGPADHDLPVGPAGIGVAATEYGEYQTAKQQKVQQWLAQQPPQHDASPLTLWRVPIIGEA